MKPLIGINLNQDEKKFTLEKPYWDAITAAGGIPVPLAPIGPIDDLDAILEALDGVLLTGGGDIDPARFGQKPHASVKPVLQPKHDSDFQLAARVLEFGLPVLGVCYGMQLLTVLHGGDLIQDVPSMVKGCHDHWGSPEKDTEHPVRVEPGSAIHRILGCGSNLTINSHHHQSAGKTGSFRVTARAEDGVIEAVEPAEPGKAFILGVQWHPERMKGPEQLAIYRALVDAAAQYRDGSGYDVTILK